MISLISPALIMPAVSYLVGTGPRASPPPRRAGHPPRFAPPGRLVRQATDRGEDRAEVIRASVRRDERQKVAREPGDLEARGDFDGGGALGARRHPGPRQERAERRC